MMDLTGKTALITGASRGIGKAIALKLAGQGANIAIPYLGDPAEAEQAQKEIEALREQVERLECPEDKAAQAVEKSKEWEKRFEEYRYAKVISQELISAFVDRIQVWADGSIKITFLFDNELKALQAQHKILREEVA